MIIIDLWNITSTVVTLIEFTSYSIFKFAFVGKYLRGVSYCKLQVYDVREWPIRIISHRSKLFKGRIASYKENGLKEGDDCVFEKIEGKNSVLKLTIFRADEDGKNGLLRLYC
ncbi:hypothetical protein SADUNF_Sadunf04G0097100 [Salix dunnii]|uniref:TF-B3 domain-containing protein n=1 Tax=Salix dunnii TaxID=1413687 RepID=A0A835KBK2_9ROSI|nr:hypothetical protein SADUNF_Sadunf04G0097100 [Salix dunnii]